MPKKNEPDAVEEFGKTYGEEWVDEKLKFKSFPVWNSLVDRVRELSDESFLMGQASTKRRGKPDTDRDKALLALYQAIKPKVKGSELLLECILTDFRTYLWELLDTVYPHLRYLPDPSVLFDEMGAAISKPQGNTECIKAAAEVANIHAERALQAVFDMSDEEYAVLQTQIREILYPPHILTPEPEPFKSESANGQNPIKHEDMYGQEIKFKEKVKPSNIPGKVFHVPASEDAWVDRTTNMVCGTCMNYLKKGRDHRGKLIGACKNNSPTIKGYPRVFDDEQGCGAHKLAVYPDPK